jgi:hypothetical protein
LFPVFPIPESGEAAAEAMGGVMARYLVTIQRLAQWIYVVEADSVEEAEAKAEALSKADYESMPERDWWMTTGCVKLGSE